MNKIKKVANKKDQKYSLNVNKILKLIIFLKFLELLEKNILIG